MKTYKIMKRTGIFETVPVEVKSEKGETITQDIEKEILEEVRSYQSDENNFLNKVRLVAESITQDTGIEHVVEVIE